MKTKVRVYRTKESLGYSHLYIEFLTDRYRDSNYLKVACTVTFQSDSERDYWYGYEMNVATDSVIDLAYALKVAKEINTITTDYKKNPEEILKGLNAEVHVYYDGRFLPTSLNGCNVYELLRDDKVYTHIYAHNDKKADAIAKAKYTSHSYGNEMWALNLIRENIDLSCNLDEILTPNK